MTPLSPLSARIKDLKDKLISIATNRQAPTTIRMRAHQYFTELCPLELRLADPDNIISTLYDE